MAFPAAAPADFWGNSHQSLSFYPWGKDCLAHSPEPCPSVGQVPVRAAHLLAFFQVGLPTTSSVLLSTRMLWREYPSQAKSSSPLTSQSAAATVRFAAQDRWSLTLRRRGQAVVDGLMGQAFARTPRCPLPGPHRSHEKFLKLNSVA